MLYQCPYCKQLTDIDVDASYLCPHCNQEVVLYNIDDFVIVDEKLKQYKGNRKDVIIPKNVRIIDNFAFSLSRNIEKVYLHEHIYKIGNEAFSKALNFKIIYIPNNIIEMGDSVFSGCNKLTIITNYKTKPRSWSSLWNSSKIPVIWGIKQYKIDDKFTYVVNSNNDIYLLQSNDKNIETIDLSNYYNNPVKGICRCCFEDSIKLEEVILPNKLEFIGKYAFDNCLSLNKIKLPNSLKTLGKYAFNNCVKLNKMVIPINLRRLEMDSFSNGNLNSLTVLSSKTVILRGVEWNRKALESLILPSDLFEINSLVFKSCTSLSYMKISKKLRGKFTIPTRCVVETYEDINNKEKKPTRMIRILERIDKGIGVKATFLDRRAYRYNCYYNVEVGDIVYAIYKGQKIKGVVVDYLDQISTLPNVNTITEVYRMVPDDYDFSLLDEGFFNNEKTIDRFLFALDRLKEGTVEEKYYNYYISYLKDVLYFNGNNLIKNLLDNFEYDYINILLDNYLLTHNPENLIEYCALNNHLMMIPMFMQYNSISDYQPNIKVLTKDYIIKGNQIIDEVNIPNSVIKIEEGVFEDTFIKKVNYYGTIEDYLKIILIGKYSNPLINNGDFYYYDNGLVLLKELVIPKGIKRINDYSFAFINSLEKVILNEELEYIGSDAFFDCFNLRVIELNESLTTIEKGAFSGTSIKTIKLPKNLNVIKSRLFKDCRELETIELPESITQIEDYAFYSCSKLTKINLTNNLLVIGESAFANCRALENVDIPDSVKALGGSCFLACANLKTIKLSKSLRMILPFTFRMCSSLIEIVIPNGVTKIGSFAFDKCSSLVEIKLTNTIKTIGLRCFKDCVNLKRFLIPLGMENIGLGAFENCSGLRVVYIPKSVYTIENNAFLGCKNLIICVEISESKKMNDLYNYFGLNNLLNSCIIKWDYKINRK